jgi:hypothetical protein
MLVISDANVLIDIEIGALTSYIFNLPFEVAVPDVLCVKHFLPTNRKTIIRRTKTETIFSLNPYSVLSEFFFQDKS